MLKIIKNKDPFDKCLDNLYNHPINFEYYRTLINVPSYTGFIVNKLVIFNVIIFQYRYNLKYFKIGLKQYQDNF
jgi:hypothetical protein